MERMIFLKTIMETEKEIRAKYSKGIIKPLEKLDIGEDKEIILKIKRVLPKSAKSTFERSAGAWKETIDAKKLIENIYTNRLLRSRPEIKL